MRSGFTSKGNPADAADAHPVRLAKTIQLTWVEVLHVLWTQRPADLMLMMLARAAR